MSRVKKFNEIHTTPGEWSAKILADQERDKQKASSRYFFDQDESSHWYMVPLELKEQWDVFTVNDLDDEDVDRFNEIFGEYMTGGGITDISFSDPQKIKT
jgi:hypothetical protein